MIPRPQGPAALTALFVAASTIAACRGAPPPAAPDPSVQPPRDAPSVPAPAATAPPSSTRPDGAPPPRIVLRAARLVQPRTSAVTAPAYVTVEGSRIVRVSREAPSETGAVPVDLGDVTLAPGLVDAHTHLLHQEPEGDDHAMIAEAASMSDADRALRGARFAKEMLRAGFTTVRDLGNSGHGGDISLKRAIARGDVEGPTMIVSGRALSPPGGQFPRLEPASMSLVDREYAVVRGPDDARAIVTQTFYEGADCIKIIVDHGPGRVLSDAELRAIVETAHRAKRKVAAHALTEEAAASAVAAGVDSVDHGYQITDATLAEMAKKKIFLVPTDYPLAYYMKFLPKDPAGRERVTKIFEKMRKTSIERVKRAKKAHVRIALGSDAYVGGGGTDRGQEAALVFRAYAESGMPGLEILQSATTEAADLLGLPEETMSLAAGGVADLVAFRGDPIADATALERVVFVMKGGKIVRRDGAPD